LAVFHFPGICSNFFARNTKFSNYSFASVDVNPEPRRGFMRKGGELPLPKNKNCQQLCFFHIFWGVVCDDVKFWLHTTCDFNTHSVIYTQKSVIFKWKVLFIYAECDYTTQIVIFTREVNLRCTNVITTHTSVISTRKVKFPPTVCNFDTYACKYDTHECDQDTQKAIPHSTHDLKQYHAEASRIHTINCLAS
jgi:hypothetical protein